MRSALLVLPLVFLAACGPAPTCPLSVKPWQRLWLDSSDWLAAHPGDTLTACLDGRCRTVTELHTWLYTTVRADPPPPMTLTVRNASGLNATRDFVPQKSFTSDRCGDHHWYETPAALNADGRLSDR
jgi:hypothetical protein